MTIDPHIIPIEWLWLFNYSAFIALAAGLFYFPFNAVLATQERQHLLWGSAAALAALWSIGVSLEGDGLRVHMLGITSVVMLVGLSPAMITGALLMLLYSLAGLSAWSMLAVNYCLLIVVPALITHCWLLLIARIPLNNLFIYMLGGGFIGGIVTRISLALLLYTMGAAAGDNSLLAINADKYLPWLLLLAFPEGFINGMIVSAMAVFFPHWLRSLDEYRYIDRRN